MLLTFSVSKYFFRKTNYRYFSCVSSILGDSKQALGQKATIKGWVKNLRSQKVNIFIDVNDGSCVDRLQVILKASQKPDNLTWGSSIEVSGSIATGVKGQVELVADEVKVVGKNDVTQGYPYLPRHRYTPEYSRQYLHFRPRTNYILSMLKVRDVASFAVYSFFNENGFTNVNTPIITGNDCEGAGEVFRIQPESAEILKTMASETRTDPEEVYFDRKVFLTVSGQMHLEAAAHSITKVFTFGPTFRAENSKSRLHLSEFYMVEGEIAFVDNLKPILKVIEDLTKHIARCVFEKCTSELKILRDEETPKCAWIDAPFPVITYDDALNLLSKNKDKCKQELIPGEALTKEHELLIVELMGGVPTFVLDWPKRIKPFYMRACSSDSEKVSALDLLAPITGEIAGGSLRENDYEALLQKLPTDALKWYLELRKFGGVPTGGFGLGFERLLQHLCCIPNIKDTIPFPRWPHNCSM